MTEECRMNVQPGQTLIYDDGRPGHRVKCVVLEQERAGMRVQFEDRARPTWIGFSEREWMDHLKEEEAPGEVQ
jgi:hypothetical protein